jgi:hypothetical protein
MMNNFNHSKSDKGLIHFCYLRRNDALFAKSKAWLLILRIDGPFSVTSGIDKIFVMLPTGWVPS